MRAVPSLTYLERQPDFSIGPEKDDVDDQKVPLAQQAEVGKTAERVQKIATETAQKDNIVPQGGLFWDGRADTLQMQASGPMLDPREMDGGSIERIAEKLTNAPYAKKFATLFGERIFKDPRSAGRRGDVRGRAISDRRSELPSLRQQVRLLAGGQGSLDRS